MPERDYLLRQNQDKNLKTGLKRYTDKAKVNYGKINKKRIPIVTTGFVQLNFIHNLIKASIRPVG